MYPGEARALGLVAKAVYNFPVGLDPMDYDEIQITHGPEEGTHDREATVLWEAPLL